MKKILGVFSAFVMTLSLAFIGDAISDNNPLAAHGQQTVTVKRKNSGGLAGKTWRGGKYVYRKGAQGTRYVYRKTKQGTVYVGKQTWRGGKWTYGKAKGGTKKAFSKTKKVLVGN